MEERCPRCKVVMHENEEGQYVCQLCKLARWN